MNLEGGCEQLAPGGVVGQLTPRVLIAFFRSFQTPFIRNSGNEATFDALPSGLSLSALYSMYHGHHFTSLVILRHLLLMIGFLRLI
jgi:hypothetical protein